MVVISEPGKELVGGGRNAKYVKECKELFLGGKGIEKIRGFEPFVNLESLWLNNNKLKKLNNLDSNFRLKALYAHDNQICTLKGSLLSFTFLETLDLSNNQLRDLDKLLPVLSKLHFLRNLNLKGNPCCEEPDYRLMVIHAMPSLQVLDQHCVTDAERRKAAIAIGGDVQAATVAFLQRVPPYNPAWDAKVPKRSVLEQELVKEAATIRDLQHAKAYEAETSLFRHNPYPDIPRGKSLPPNAGTRRAMDAHARAVAASPQLGQQGYGEHGPRSNMVGITPRISTAPAALQLGRHQSTAAAAVGTQFSDTLPRLMTEKSLPHSLGPISRQATAYSVYTSAASVAGTARVGKAPAVNPLEAHSPYVPKDELVLFSCKPGASELMQSGTRASMMVPGGIRFEQGKYESWVKRRTFGGQPWELERKSLQI